MMNDMRAILMVAVLFVSGAASAQDEPKVVPGTLLPKEIQMKVQPHHDDLRKALAKKDDKATKKACERIVQTMGRWAGNPETAPRYYKPIERQSPDVEVVWKLWREIDRRVRRDLLWVVVPDGAPARMKNGLRGAGRPVIAYSILFRLEADKQREYLRLIREGADYLLNIQRKDGLFPFPDLRGDHRLFEPMIDRLLRQKPKALVDGWIIDALNGDLQYDNGICGVAMVEAYKVTKEKRYLESARMASNWAMQQPLSTNWNYNAFSVWLLARYAQVSGDKKYLDAAMEKMKVGILPGQMKNGRWFDPHNARLVYHGIIVRGMLDVYRILDEGHEFQETLRDALVRALDNTASEIRKHGASSNSTTTEILSDALTLLGPNKHWEEALNINVNAGLRVIHDQRAPNVGIYLPNYLHYAKMNRE